MSDPKSHPATCETLVRLLSDYVDRELSPENQRRLEEHLADCPPCEVFLNTFRRAIDLSSRRAAGDRIPSALRERLHAFLAEKAPPPSE